MSLKAAANDMHHQASTWYTSLAVALVCLVTLSLPCAADTAAMHSTLAEWWPSWALPTFVQKLSAAYVLGIVTMILVR